MSDPKKDPNPIEDVRKGLGLLFRAARNVVQKLPTDKLEEAVMTGAKEVGRAMESVAQTIEKEVTKRGPSASKPSSTPPQAPNDSTATGTDGSGSSTPPPSEPKP